MPKIRLITSYLDWPAGTELYQDQGKCDQLVELGRAEFIEKECCYSNKMMVTCPKCNKKFKSEAGLKIHKSRWCK